MSVNTPPDPNVATFNNLYWISDETGLTVAEANKKYLKFPVAQGTENLQAINVNGVATFSSTASVRTSLGNSNVNSFFIRDIPTNNTLEFFPAVTEALYDNIVNAGDFAIISTGTTNLVLTNGDATATNGIRLDTDRLLLGFGGSVAGVDVPTNSITFNTANGVAIAGLTTFANNVTFGAGSDIIQVAGSQILQAPASTGYTDNNVLNITTIRTANTAVTNTPSFQIADTLNSSFLTFNPAAANNYADTIVQADDFAIAIANTPLAITHSGGTATNGIRLQTNKLLLGFGGAVDVPTNNITFDTTAGIVITSPLPPTSSATQPVATDSTAAMPTTAWVQTAITAAPAKIPISNNNTAATFYPTFTSAAGTQTGLFIDSVTGPFSFNPSTGEFVVATTLKILAGGQVAFGTNAGLSQGINSTAIGVQAGNTNMGINATALGVNAGYKLMGTNAVAVGSNSAFEGSGASSVSIGHEANNKSSAGDYSVAIGYRAGYNSQTAGSICLNASGAALDPSGAGFFVKPVRNDTTKQSQVQFNTTSNEISYVAQVVSPVTTAGLNITGDAALLSGTSGGSSGQHLVVVINGTAYKIDLKNT